MILTVCAVLTLFLPIRLGTVESSLSVAQHRGGDRRWAPISRGTLWPSRRIIFSGKTAAIASGTTVSPTLERCITQPCRRHVLPSCWLNPRQYFSKFGQDVDLINSDLLVFVGEGCTYCERMIEPIRLVEQRLGVRIIQLEVWNNPLNYELLKRIDAGRCGGLPFFYNTRSKQFICGATDPHNLLKWGTGLPCSPHLPPPPSTAELEVSKRQTGPVSRILRHLDGLRRAAEAKVAAHLENVEKSGAAQ